MGSPEAGMKSKDFVELLKDIIRESNDAFVIGQGHFRSFL
jgi:hypothetical protein